MKYSAAIFKYIFILTIIMILVSPSLVFARDGGSGGRGGDSGLGNAGNGGNGGHSQSGRGGTGGRWWQ